VTIERDETTATKLAAVSERLEAVEVRDASITCAHKNAHRALSDLEDLNERVMALAEAVGDVDRVTETALGELIAVAGKTATDVTELAKVTADELADERRKREALENAIVSLRAAVNANAQGYPSLYEEIKILQRAAVIDRASRVDLEVVLQAFIQGAREEARERKGRLDKQDEEIRALRSLQEDATEALRCVSAYIQGQQRAALGGDLLDERKRQDMIKWNQNQSEAITALSERVRTLEDERVVSTMNDVNEATERDLARLAQATADELADERRKREALENAIVSLRADVRAIARWEPVPKEDLQRLWRAIAEVRSDRDDTHTLATSAAGTQRYQARQIEELRNRLNKQDEEIRALRNDVRDGIDAHEHPEINFGEQVRQLGKSVSVLTDHVVNETDARVTVTREVHKRMDNLAMRITELERRAR
jgi:hypothetical protein